MASSEKNVTYGLKFQARAMVPFQSEGSQSRWLVGTNALRDENEVIWLLETDFSVSFSYKTLPVHKPV
jgi:hypothetical protein